MRRLLFRDFASRCVLRNSSRAVILVLAASAAHAGELKLNGSVTGSLVEVLAGDTLTGTGTFGGDVTVAGLHSPGNSPGVMVFTNLTYYGGVVEWELEGNTSDLSDRGILFDGIDVWGNLAFDETTPLSLVFDGSGSLVDWTDPFWSTEKTGTDGWLIYETGGTTTGLENLVVSGTPWRDSKGKSFLDVWPNASFGVQQVGSDVYLTLVATVPEPSTYAMALAGLACGGFSMWRRRKRA